MQNIPSHEKSIRLMFTAKCDKFNTPVIQDKVVLSSLSDIKIDGEWVNTKDLKVGMWIEDQCIEKLEDLGDKVVIYLRSC